MSDLQTPDFTDFAKRLVEAKKAKEEADKAFKDAETAFKEANKALIETRDTAKKAFDAIETDARSAVEALIASGAKPDHVGFTTRQTTDFVVTDESVLIAWLITNAPFIAKEVLKVDTKKLESLLSDNTHSGKLSPILLPIGEQVQIVTKTAPQINWAKLV